jgi:TolA-binding protein
MAKIKIDKHAIKENELDHYLVYFKNYLIEKPKQILIPVIITLAVVVIAVVASQYIKKQNQASEIKMLTAQKDFREALANTDKSSQIISLNRAKEQFKQIANDYSWTPYGKIAKVYYADCFYNGGKYDDAIKYYREAIGAGVPKIAGAWAQMSLGYSYMNKNDYPSALKEFDNVSVKFPDSFLVPSARLQSAACYEKMNNLVKAKEIYESIIKNYPDSMWIKEAQARLIAIGGASSIPKAG